MRRLSAAYATTGFSVRRAHHSSSPTGADDVLAEQQREEMALGHRVDIGRALDDPADIDGQLGQRAAQVFPRPFLGGPGADEQANLRCHEVDLFAVRVDITGGL